MEQIVEYYPKAKFQGFDPSGILTVFTLGKKGAKGRLAKLYPIKYPHDVATDGKKVYIAEIKGSLWRALSDRKKWMTVLRLMCQIPEGGFDEQSKEYAKLNKPDYEMFKTEFEAANGIPNWLEDDSKLKNLPVGTQITGSVDVEAAEPAEEKEEEEELAEV